MSNKATYRVNKYKLRYKYMYKAKYRVHKYKLRYKYMYKAKYRVHKCKLRYKYMYKVSIGYTSILKISIKISKDLGMSEKA